MQRYYDTIPDLSRNRVLATWSCVQATRVDLCSLISIAQIPNLGDKVVDSELIMSFPRKTTEQPRASAWDAGKVSARVSVSHWGMFEA